jgi:hypothetical protein
MCFSLRGRTLLQRGSGAFAHNHRARCNPERFALPRVACRRHPPMKTPFGQLFTGARLTPVPGLSRPGDGATGATQPSGMSARLQDQDQWCAGQPQKTDGGRGRRGSTKASAQTQAAIAVTDARQVPSQAAPQRSRVRPRAPVRCVASSSRVQEPEATQRTQRAPQTDGQAADGATRPGTPDSFESTSSVGSVDAIYLRPRRSQAAVGQAKEKGPR